MEHSESGAVPTHVPLQDEPPGMRRRDLLGYAASAPLVSAAAAATVGLGGIAAPSSAKAAILPMTPPDTTDLIDIGDAVTLTALPTMPLVKVTNIANGRVRLELPRLESGQGIATAAAMMLADKLRLPLSAIEVGSADASPELIFNQLTGGSSSVRSLHAGMPLLGGLGGLLSGSANAVVGQRTTRLDALDIVTGRKKFSMDQAVPEAKPTMVCRPPTINGKFVRINNLNTVTAMPGVLGIAPIPATNGIVPTPPGVAVMAETFGQAWAAVNALDVTWTAGPVAGESNASIQQKLKGALLPFLLPPLGALTVEGEFEFAAVSHCPMETECAIADVRADRAEIWSGLQSPIVTQQAIAIELGLPLDKVKVHAVPSGGSFGRRLFWDATLQAVQASKALGRPCKLMYHRTDDMRHGRVRPPMFHRARATMLLGQVIAFEQRIAGVRLDTRHGFGEMLGAAAIALPNGFPQTVGNFAIEQVMFKTMVTSPYNFGVTTKLLTPVPIDMNTCSYRSVHIQPSRLVEEILVDDMARALRKDPVAFRLEYLRLPRARAVLKAAAAAAQWGKAMPAGFAQGVGVHQESKSFTACIVEIDGRVPTDVKVIRATIVIDVGTPINPSGIEAQMQGGLCESISIVLTAGLHIQNGLPLEGSYSQYHFARMKSYPKDVKVIIMPASTGEAIGGLGEVGLSASSGAIANAYARATGRKPRSFPLNFPVDFTPIPPGKLPTPVVVPVPA
ncbi:isoquinoline 1-oxidoreductase beta subunit [Variovorax boronicumulans]|uniref:Isoquinoline 1-oxidoreductase beta subunit n=1 Tax=Variovorax boronicumulans TaxID=436515 RepID=A0AAW8CZD0_9BURK|nr:molybdopterin cofactor-binding domain-containing protein [Variovorax boronicumulans]MDP9893828.1 isoquinoline 1-oxidoreductase beta subunit [Variovorax boronicumulans]MDP9993371.1 isoquinoline 1-oxidoreductase beta subunit [Variovorax boronicumulans]MDQ0004762.1 isoquinoline 1-oxidoreductase beta subunit [Variovorax boronicumulans]MDQ0053645.1 isoquinoline 1-oxidoreductase beta subunit [Variovorax boronicumulans]